jgi:integrase
MGICRRDRNREEMHFLTHEQVQALAEAISWNRLSHGHERRDERHRALILTAAYTGMRAGELHGLRVERFDQRAGVIHVIESLAEVPRRADPSGLRLGPTKTGRPRSIRLLRPVRRVLEDHLRRFPSSDGWVFPAETGGPVRHGNFYARRFKPAVARAGLPDVCAPMTCGTRRRRSSSPTGSMPSR